MEDIIVSVPKSDASFRQVFERAQQESSVDHEWTLDEINAEIKAAREERAVNGRQAHSADEIEKL